MNTPERFITRRQFQSELEKKFGTSEHPKADKLFEFAWAYGHAEGAHEVEMYYEELRELLEDKP